LFPQTERQDDESRARRFPEESKKGPGARVAAQVQQTRNEQDQREENSDGGVAQFLAEAFRLSEGRAGVRAQWSCALSGLQLFDFAHAGEGAADMRNGNGADDDQGDVERVNDFLALPAFFAARTK